MSSKPVWIIRQSLKKVWVRVVGFAGLAVLTASSAPFLAPLVPAGLAVRVGAEAVGQILTILASSMLAVTTFSLSVAVSAFAAAASTATPRATALLQEDPTTQNVLATFLGAFLFSLLGLIALRTDVYDRSGETVLFLATLAVVALVILALLRWIGHLMSFGRMADTLDRVERAAAESLAQRLADPYLGGRPLRGAAPADASAVCSTRTGYVQHVDMPALSDCAGAMEAELYLAALPGAFVHAAAPLVQVRAAAPSEDQADTLRGAFTLANERSFDQDPRFGLIVLAEVCSRALSPAVNDPGTAISVVGRLVRVLSSWREEAEPEIAYPAVHVPPVLAADMIDDAFRPIARDGAGLVEVQVRLQKALDALRRVAPEVFGAAAAAMSAYALERAGKGGLTDRELGLVAGAAAGSDASAPAGAGA